MSLSKWFWFAALLMCTSLAAAQDNCPIVVQEALANLNNLCGTTGRNQACYGNVALTAAPQQGITQFKFDTEGDIANLSDIRTLDLEPYNDTTETWGLAIMQVQANIPDSLPGQNVTFIIFGDTTIENAVQAEKKPMQDFYLTTGVGNSNCVEMPESGLMVQTPSGVRNVTFTINGVEVEMGSTVVFQAQPQGQMRVKTLEGKAVLKVGEKTIRVVQGSEFVAPIDENLSISGEGTVTPYQEENVQSFPIEGLERSIEIAAPLTEEQIDYIEESIDPLCSDETDTFLPPCKYPVYDVNGHEIQYDADGYVLLTDENGEPLLYDENGTPITSMEDYYRFTSEWADETTFVDEVGYVVEVEENGEVSVMDDEGDAIVAFPDGDYTYTSPTGETYAVEELLSEELNITEMNIDNAISDPVSNSTDMPTLSAEPIPDVTSTSSPGG